MTYYDDDLGLEVHERAGLVDLATPGKVALTPTQARRLAHALTQAADEADPDAVAEEEAISELIGERTDYSLHVEGRVVVPWFIADKRAQAHRLVKLATDLGLQPFYQAVIEGEDPDRLPLNKRWTFRRVTAETLTVEIARRPGVKFKDLLERLYGEPNWSPQARRNATGKLRTALYKLRHAGAVVQRFDADGVERWQLPRLATGLRLTPAGPSAAVPDETGLPLTPLDEGLEAGAARLRTYKLFSDEAEARDPRLYLDLARQLFQEILHGAQAPPT